MAISIALPGNVILRYAPMTSPYLGHTHSTTQPTKQQLLPAATSQSANHQQKQQTRDRIGHRQQQWLEHWLERTLSDLGEELVAFLTGASHLSIRKSSAPYKITGSPSQQHAASPWVVYDSTTDTRHCFESEQAVRAWLETRHRQ